MNICLSSEAAAIDGLQLGFCVANQLQPYPPGGATAVEVGIVEAVSAAYTSRESLSEHPFERIYAEFYRAMGLNPKRVSTPIRQALRVSDTKRYKSIGPIIDACMKIEYTSLISFQVYDAERVRGDVRFELASGNETVAAFHGTDENVRKGEFILRDRESVLHAASCGNNRLYAVNAGTRRCLVRTLLPPGMPESLMQAAIAAFHTAVPGSRFVMLSADRPSVDLSV